MQKGQLFTEYFLKEGIKNTQDYKSIKEDELKNILEDIEKIYLNFRERKNPDEADTEDGLIIPILDKLGFFYSRQKSPQKGARTDIPDFVLFSNYKDKEEFDKANSNKKPWTKPICILEGKRFGRKLDKKDIKDIIDPSVPSGQILRYMSSVEIASNGKILWGILTNGKIWRLYYYKYIPRSEGYIEIDLDEIFERNLFSNNNLELFKVFYLFFRKEAFIKTDKRPTKTFLEIALEEGKRWEEKVTENLKERIFSDIFRLLAQGLIEDAKKKKENINDRFLKEVYDNTLIFLYRLLFIFYAEDRNLLPITNSNYKDYSLLKIRDDIEKEIEENKIFSETATTYWDRLKNLFKIINSGDKNLNVPPYNGGLFDSNFYPFLEKFSISDKYLAPVIDRLSRDYSFNPPHRINYRDLSVRELGSIYEGLLEFKLKIANTDLKVVKEKGKEIYKPAEKNEKIEIKRGEVYLTNDKSERKATGSYYTPDYIVQYIVRNTLEPVIQEKIEEFRKKIKELKTSYKYKSQTSKWKNKKLKNYDLFENILNIKILDPAMGSGHFLVGAVDYLADRIFELLPQFSNKKYFGNYNYISPLEKKLEEMRKDIIKNLKKIGIEIEPENLEDKNLIKRIILKRCIYGVDLNPLAVELAKLSLWLHTFTIGAPLSFLDHHLKCGNSLIGAEPEDFEDFLKKGFFTPSFIGIMNAIQGIKKIEQISDIDIKEIQEDQKIYNDIIKQIEPFKRILDIYTAGFFENSKRKKISLTHSLFDKYNSLSLAYGKIKLKPDDKKIFDSALSLAKQKRFFHWKLEFPEIWYEGGKKKENGGFDVIIGNPPYVMEVRGNKEIFRDLQLSPTVGKYYEDKMDIFYFFIEQGIDLLRKGGFISFIVLEYWLTREKAKKLRNKFFKETLPKEFILFKEFNVFKEAPGQHNLIFITQKSKPASNEKISIRILEYENLKRISEKERMEIEKIIFESLDKRNNIFKQIEKELKFLYSEKRDRVYILDKYTTTLEDLKRNENNKCFNLENEEIQQGVVLPQPYLRQTGEGIFVLKEEEYQRFNWTNDELKILKPFYYAEEIDRYFYPVKNKNYLIYTPVEIALKLEIFDIKNRIKNIKENELNAILEEYPHFYSKIRRANKRGKITKNFLENFVKKFDIGDYKNIVSHLNKYKNHITSDHRPFGIHRARQPEWFEDKNKIIGIRKTKYPKFVVIKEPFYIEQSGYIIRLLKHKDYSPYYLLSFLNSKFGWWWFYHQKTQGKQLQIDKEVLKDFPFPEINFKDYDSKELKKLKEGFKKVEYEEIIENIKNINPNSKTLHDFLSFLAEKMTEYHRKKYLLELFINDKIKHGTGEMIEIISELEKHPEWKKGISDELKKEIALNCVNQLKVQITHTDKLIDQIVYYIYGLTDKEKQIVEKFFER